MNRRERHGFTLVELLIVVGILSVLLAGTIPAFRGSFREACLRRAALDVADTLRYARTLAVSEERVWAVRFDRSERSFRAIGLSALGEALDEAETEDATAERRLPRDVFIAETSYSSDSNRFAVAFYPDGSSESGDIRLSAVGSGRAQRTIAVAGHDGGVAVEGEGLR